jgi:hypothetical protein
LLIPAKKRSSMKNLVFLRLRGARGLLVLSLLGVACACSSEEASESPSEKAIAIDWVEPECAEPGSTAYIEGKGFGGGNVRITVGGIDAEIISATGRYISFVVPEGLAPGAVEVVVTNPGGRIARINWVVCEPGNLQIEFEVEEVWD